MGFRQGFVVTSAPASEPLTTVEVKAQSRIDISDDDTLIDRLIVAARKYVERRTRRALIDTEVEITSNSWYASRRHILDVIAPISAVASVTYYDESDALQTLSSSLYHVGTVTEPASVHVVDGESWPSLSVRPGAVIVKATAGYGADATSVPDDLKHAMLLLIGHWYENREGVSELNMNTVPLAVESILGMYDRPEFW